ncbi:hypothetical protein GGU11DRAFT_760732 [Lentinula aff. detonsa]|nr:hypothetical protein GGU11DRAFT_760732 [Lentinula aff. detonsa]
MAEGRFKVKFDHQGVGPRGNEDGRELQRGSELGRMGGGSKVGKKFAKGRESEKDEADVGVRTDVVDEDVRMDMGWMSKFLGQTFGMDPTWWKAKLHIDLPPAGIITLLHLSAPLVEECHMRSLARKSWVMIAVMEAASTSGKRERSEEDAPAAVFPVNGGEREELEPEVSGMTGDEGDAGGGIGLWEKTASGVSQRLRSRGQSRFQQEEGN